MASTVTVQNLMDRTRRYADIENATNRFTDAEIQDYLKTAHRKWTDFVLNNGGAELLETTSSGTTVANTATYTLPTDFYRLLGITATVDGVPIPLTRLPIGEREKWGTNQFTWGGLRRVYYRRSGATQLTFYPTPDAAYSYTIYYVPEAEVDFTTTSNTVDGVNGWDDFVVLTAAMKVLTKDNRPGDMVSSELRDLKDSIKGSIKNLDSGQAPRITNIHEREARFPFRWRY